MMQIFSMEKIETSEEEDLAPPGMNRSSSLPMTVEAK